MRERVQRLVLFFMIEIKICFTNLFKLHLCNNTNQNTFKYEGKSNTITYFCINKFQSVLTKC